VRPTASWSASKASKSHATRPSKTSTTKATTTTVPITAWLKRGARESITSVSRYGSAVRMPER
jgi:hypothetical protein